jgi:hypothetical protein
MLRSLSRRSWAAGCAALALVAWLVHAALSPSAAETAQGTVGPQKKAEALGITFEKVQPGYLNGCARSGKLLMTSGFASKMEGRLGKVLGCVNSSPDFVDQPAVINGCSDLLHEIFGKQTDGYHARSALGFAALPKGKAVEIEAIFEIKD